MPLIQLQPHPFTSLPAHSSLTTDSPRPELKEYTSTAFHEALELLHSIPTTFTEDRKRRSSPPSEAKVNLLRGWRNPPAQEGSSAKDKSEFWVARQSEHVDSAAPGTASWSEFEAGLRVNHAEHEMEYTPSVAGVERLLEWREDEIGEIEVDGVVFRDVNVEGEFLFCSILSCPVLSPSILSSLSFTTTVNLITHTFNPSALISPRSFISLTISAAYEPPSWNQQTPETKTKGFLTIQLPLTATPSTTPAALHQKITSAVPRRTIFANYASVERVSLLSTPSSAQPAPSRSIEWTMATTSDAGGSIPQWIQRSWALGGMPKAVVADVGLFIGWIMRRRRSA